MSGLISWLEGKKTFLVALVGAGLAFAQASGYVVPEWVFALLGSLGLTTLRLAVGSRNV